MLEFFKKLFGRADVNKDGKVDAVDTADIAIAQLPDLSAAVVKSTAAKPAAKKAAPAPKKPAAKTVAKKPAAKKPV